jgi:hypothetical protein
VFERFTKDARRVVVTSLRVAAETGADKAGPAHLLLAVADDDGVGSRLLAGYGVTAASLRAAGGSRRATLTEDEIRALSAFGIDAEEVFRRVEEAFGPDALDEPAGPPPRRRRGLLGAPFDGDGRKVLELSLREAVALHSRAIGSEHILLALLRVGVPDPMSTVLSEHAVTYDDAKRRALAEPG